MKTDSQTKSAARPLSDRFLEAVEFASKVHSKQTRKGTDTPYIGHLLDVAATVIDAGGDEELVIAALLHDAVEDQGGIKTLDEIRQKFGPRIAEIVEACSDSTSEPKRPWRERKEAYIAHLESADADVRLVAAADKLSNAGAIALDLKTVGDEVWDRFNAPKEDQLWYYYSVTFALHDGPADPRVSRILTALRDVVRQIRHLANGPGVEELLNEATFSAKTEDYPLAIQFARMVLFDGAEAEQAADAVQLIEDCQNKLKQARSELPAAENDALHHPQNGEKAFYLGLLLSRIGNLSQSTTQYEKALKFKESMCIASHRDCLNNIGWNAFRQGDYKESLGWFKKSLALVDPEHPKPYPLAMENMILANARLERVKDVEKLIREYVATIGRLPRYESIVAHTLGLDADRMFLERTMR